MAQFAWNVKPNGGHNFKVGLYHGDETGHVMLYCNNAIMHVDFSVKEDRTLSLMLDQELCLVTIKKQADGSFAYDCQLDEAKMAAKAAARKAKREQEKKHEKQRITLAVGFVVFLALVAWWYSI